MILTILLLCYAYICSAYDIRGTYSWSPRGTYEGTEGSPLTVRCYFSNSDPHLPIHAVILKEQWNSYGIFSTSGSPFGSPQITRNGNRGKIFWHTESATLGASGNYSCIISQYPKDESEENPDSKQNPNTEAVTLTFADLEVKIKPKTDTEEHTETEEDKTKFEVEVREDPVTGSTNNALVIECFYRGAHPGAHLLAELKKEPEEHATENGQGSSPEFAEPNYSDEIDGTGKVTWGAKKVVIDDSGKYSCILKQEYNNPETGEQESDTAKTTFMVTISDPDSEDSDEYLVDIFSEDEQEDEDDDEEEEETKDEQSTENINHKNHPDKESETQEEASDTEKDSSVFRRKRSLPFYKIRQRRSILKGRFQQ